MIQNHNHETGSASVELVMLVPVLVLVLMLLFAAGRIATAETVLQNAANSGAREASLARSTAQAQQNALVASNNTITQHGYTCTDLHITVNDDGITAPLGEVGKVSVTITCQLNLADLGLNVLGDTKEITATAVSPVDPFRERPE